MNIKITTSRVKAFIHCSLTGTALSWYIRLNDTYEPDWSALVKTFEKQVFLKRTLIVLKLMKLLHSLKRQ